MGTVTASRPLEEWAGQRVYRAIESVTQRGSQRSGPAGAWLRCADACLAWRQLAPLLTPPSYGLCFLRTSSLETICRTSSLETICHGPCTVRWRRCPMGTVTASRPLEEWAGQRVYRAIESVTQRGSQRSGPAGAWLRCADACLAWRQLAPLLTPPSNGLCFLRTSSLETICRTSSLGAICHGPCTVRWRRCPMGTVTSSRPLEEWAGQRVYRAIYRECHPERVAAQWASWCVAEVR